VIRDLEEFKEIHNWLNGAPPCSMRTRLSGGESVGFISNMENKLNFVTE